MKKTDKSALIKELSEKINEYSHFYVTDTLGLNASQTSDLRRACFNKDVKMMVVKNTLFQLALEQSEKQVEGMEEAFKGTSAVLFCNTGNVPAKLIKEFQKATSLPVLKGAYVEESVYMGSEQLETLSTIKSKEELLGDVIGLLQSPAKNVISALQSGGTKIHGILQTLSEKE
ncbi:50S ribosomal protein L10 [Marinilabilia salmonicolor]|jgi:large subunit ribosomal protein L10|uniref:Large ribosomal subunit protein uL10 n=1 Tax=Marinilabilia salmonicolor TaxID=989 RepID=A0A368V8F5_9BACT|nr:50S ribosomal protein L10 [Marinilabilia salmonicolor]RCW35271.1 LSU ribosomal protein L10P [Marinilabilia salmonicolor]